MATSMDWSWLPRGLCLQSIMAYTSLINDRVFLALWVWYENVGASQSEFADPSVVIGRKNNLCKREGNRLQHKDTLIYTVGISEK